MNERTVTSKNFGNASADAAGSTGDNRCFSTKIEQVHILDEEKKL